MDCRSGIARLVLGLMLFVAFAPAARGQKLQIVLAVEQNDEVVAKSLDLAARSFKTACEKNVPKAQLTIREIDPEDFTAEGMLEAIDAVRVEPNDCLMFYYCGHGVHSEEEDQTCITPRKGTEAVSVSAICRRLQSKAPRQSVAILDCCNILESQIGRGPITYYAPVPSASPIVTPLFRALFFEARDQIVIQSSAKGEYAIVKPNLRKPDDEQGTVQQQGTLFTDSLCQVLSRSHEALPWLEICNRTQQSMNAEFAKWCPDGVLNLSHNRRISQSSQTVTLIVNGQPQKN